ncbi:hypothetical protein QTH90_15815 [Variovorax sp. J2P1-59]|uniref:hypothetical protein n=1 Tax=Variovorax flavidus TaxID=3053501 RepID=UPI0025773C67|nr:hypothetical protein [Variovorax sp. J2P1-59]MDM0075870.1 hypothetical protein [Variovorax sp. J2P1-59]
MKPSDFFFGAMDFFAVLLPGAILTFLLIPLGSVFAPVVPAFSTAPEKWLAFGACSYLFGHLLHHAASFLDALYDGYAKHRRRRFGDDLLLTEAKRLTTEDLGENYSDGTSTFHWASSYVKANNAAASAEIERSGADSKFFRSLCLVSGIATVLFLMRGWPSEGLVPAALAFALTVFAYQRFRKLRWETTKRVYEYFVLLRKKAPR